jgi:hypothetical protein
MIMVLPASRLHNFQFRDFLAFGGGGCNNKCKTASKTEFVINLSTQDPTLDPLQNGSWDDNNFYYYYYYS